MAKVPQKAERMDEPSKAESEVALPQGPTKVMLVFERDAERGGWKGCVEGFALRARGDSVRRVRLRLKRALKLALGMEAFELEERVVLSTELEAEVDSFVARQKQFADERAALATDRIVLAKHLLRFGVPQRVVAVMLQLSGARLGIILMEEATGKRPRVLATPRVGGAERDLRLARRTSGSGLLREQHGAL